MDTNESWTDKNLKWRLDYWIYSGLNFKTIDDLIYLNGLLPGNIPPCRQIANKNDYFGLHDHFCDRCKKKMKVYKDNFPIIFHCVSCDDKIIYSKEVE